MEIILLIVPFEYRTPILFACFRFDITRQEKNLMQKCVLCANSNHLNTEHLNTRFSDNRTVWVSGIQMVKSRVFVDHLNSKLFDKIIKC